MLPMTRVRAVPWSIVIQIAMTARKHWRRLDAKDRARLAELLRKSQGKPGNLSPKERAEVRRIVALLEPREFARSVVPIGRRAMKGRVRR